MTARGPGLLRVARLLTGDAHLAQDLSQTVLTKVWPEWRRLADENPQAYVRKALVNTHASWWQRRRRGETPHEQGRMPEESGADDPFAAVDPGQSLSLVVRVLPPRQRAVAVLRHFEELSVEETAQVRG